MCFLSFHLQNLATRSVVDPNGLCSDPDPGSQVHLDPDPDLAPEFEQDPNKFESGSGSYLNLTNFLKIKALTDVKMIFLVLKFFFQKF